MKKIIAIIIALLIITGVYANEQIKINNLKQELLEASKPSKIEIQKTELVKLEKDWRTTENTIQILREKLTKLESIKPKIEVQIRTKRNEILGK